MELILLRESLNKFEKGGIYDNKQLAETIKEIDSVPVLPTKEDLQKVQVCLYWVHDIKAEDKEVFCNRFKYEFNFWEGLDESELPKNATYHLPIEDWQKPILINNIEFELDLYSKSLKIQEKQLKRLIGYSKRLELEHPFRYTGTNHDSIKDMFDYLVDHKIILRADQWKLFKMTLSGNKFPAVLIRFCSSKAAAYFIKMLSSSPHIDAHKYIYIQGSKCYCDEKGQSLPYDMKNNMPKQSIKKTIERAIALLE